MTELQLASETLVICIKWSDEKGNEEFTNQGSRGDRDKKKKKQ